MTDNLTPIDRIRQSAAAWLNTPADALAWLSDMPDTWTVLRPRLGGHSWTVRRHGATLHVAAGPVLVRWTPAYPLPADPTDLIRLALALLAYTEPGDDERLPGRSAS